MAQADLCVCSQPTQSSEVQFPLACVFDCLLLAVYTTCFYCESGRQLLPLDELCDDGTYAAVDADR